MICHLPLGVFIEVCALKKDSMKKLLKGQPSLIIRNGEWDMKQMKNNHLDLEQVRTMLSSGSA
ncbi:YetF domain-containing protein [Peribacillus sp. FSL E2-0218]|uniref:YetF domain-containing protein n=1 Tax=Peribacillus sp. FSL E2-0218 TaxID=2921364 RepID=UPI0030EE45C4